MSSVAREPASMPGASGVTPWREIHVLVFCRQNSAPVTSRSVRGTRYELLFLKFGMVSPRWWTRVGYRNGLMFDDACTWRPRHFKKPLSFSSEEQKAAGWSLW